MCKNLTLAEGLALFRIITFPLLLASIFLVEKSTFFWIYIILFATDAFDGWAAIMQKNDSDRREILDTWGDNLYFIAGTVAIFHYHESFFEMYIGMIVIIYAMYGTELVLSIIKFGKPSNFHNYMAKAAAFSQAVFLAYSFYYKPSIFLFYLAFALSILDVIDELIILKRLDRWKTHVNGFWDVKVR